MKIYAINNVQHNYSKNNFANTKRKLNENQPNISANTSQTAFKGTKGGVLGIIAGAAAGAGIAALTIATGGLAGIVAAVGATSTIVGGAAAGTHIGGIAGSIIEDKLEEKDNKQS